jgi:hypothetical protein
MGPRRAAAVSRASVIRRLRRWARRGAGVVGTASPAAVEPPRRLDGRGDARLIVVCAWCGKFRVGGTWVAAVEAADLEWSTHGICPACLESLECLGDDVARA